MKLMSQDLKKTEESGEWEVKVLKGNQQRMHKSRTLPLCSWEFINRPVALLHPGAEPARPNERRPQSGPLFALAGSRGVAWSVTAKALPCAGCAVRLESLLPPWRWFLRVKFLSPDPGKTSLLAPVSHPGVSVISNRRFTGDEEKT